MNIKLEYLYRDAGNFKNWGEIIFSNPMCLNTAYLSELAKTILIDGVYFVASAANVPELRFPDYVSDLDHDWHEFHAFVFTDQPPTDTLKRDIVAFIDALKHSCVQSSVYPKNHIFDNGRQSRSLNSHSN